MNCYVEVINWQNTNGTSENRKKKKKNEKEKIATYVHPDDGFLLLTIFLSVLFTVPLFSVYFFTLSFAELFSSPNSKQSCANFVISNCVSICAWILLSINCYSNQSAELNGQFEWRLQRTANHDVVHFSKNSIQCIIKQLHIKICRKEKKYRLPHSRNRPYMSDHIKWCVCFAAHSILNSLTVSRVFFSTSSLWIMFLYKNSIVWQMHVNCLLFFFYFLINNSRALVLDRLSLNSLFVYYDSEKNYQGNEC